MILKTKLGKPLVLLGLTLGAAGTSSFVELPVTESVVSAEDAESSLLDGVLDLVKEKGSDIIKEYLPTVGDFLCTTIFDYFGIDYSDSFTKRINEVNEKLESIQSDLKTVIKNQTKAESQTTISSYLNIVDVFSDVIHPIYQGYNDLLLNEKKGMTKEEAKASEEKFYNNNLKNLLFGNRSSTGNLYTQLCNLADTTVSPNSTSHKTLMEHYVVSFEHRWAFNTQSFEPKREFLGYASANLLQGLTLYSFQHLEETQIYKDDSSQLTVLDRRWKNIKDSTKAAFQYLQKEIKTLAEEEKKYTDGNMVRHYSTGKEFCKKLYVGGIAANEDSHFTYASRWTTTRQGNTRSVTIDVLNARDLANTIQKEFAQYKENYRKGSSCTLAEFLQSAGFTCTNWNNKGLYRGQSMYHSGAFLTNEYWKFYVEYTDTKGNAVSAYNGRVKYKVAGSPTPQYGEAANWTFMAFVGTDGILDGIYDRLYDENGNTLVDAMYSFARRAVGYSPTGTQGKVW